MVTLVKVVHQVPQVVVELQVLQVVLVYQVMMVQTLVDGGIMEQAPLVIQVLQGS